MPAELFDPKSRPASAGAGRRLTVTTSVVIHLLVVVAVVVVPLIGGVSLPAAVSRIDAFVAPPSTPPIPPAPQPPAAASPAPRLNPNAAPIEAPPEITAERPRLDVAVAPGVAAVPGGIPGAALGVPGGVPNVPAPAPAPPPQKPQPVRPGGVVQFPKRVSYVEPAYPSIAQTARVEGTVILEATIDETGAVTNVKVLRSIPLLDAAAVEAVRKWRYSPTTLNGIRVPVVMTVTVTFTLR